MGAGTEGVGGALRAHLCWQSQGEVSRPDTQLAEINHEGPGVGVVPTKKPKPMNSTVLKLNSKAPLTGRRKDPKEPWGTAGP